MNIVVDRSFLIWLGNQDKDKLIGELSVRAFAGHRLAASSAAKWILPLGMKGGPEIDKWVVLCLTPHFCL